MDQDEYAHLLKIALGNQKMAFEISKSLAEGQATLARISSDHGDRLDRREASQPRAH